jgi:hypothetical protein
MRIKQFFYYFSKKIVRAENIILFPFYYIKIEKYMFEYFY